MHWLLHVLGIDTQQSFYYDFWSGVGTQISLVIAAVSYYRHHNCHVHGCPRIGKHEYGHYLLCKRHHPNVPTKVTFDHINGLKEVNK